MLLKSFLKLLPFCALVLSTKANAQIELSKSNILFIPTNELSKDSSTIIIYNRFSANIAIDSITSFKTYSRNAFNYKLNKGIIAPGDSVSVTIYFEPNQNIFHNSELLIITKPSAYSFAIDLKGQGKFSNTYYNATENLSEDALKAVLKSIISAGYVSLGYNGARDKMFMEFDNQKVNGQGATVNTLECVYTGRKTVGYIDRTDAQSTGDPTKNFNTEHTFPQGFFNQNEPMRSDIHHLFPTDNPANNSRGNFPFGIATQPYQNESINNPSHLGSNNLYEPRDVQKGKTARAMMYFVIRYSDYSNHFAPQENILRTWHNQFPPDAIEKKRNADIASVQKNRNPFVDYPQFNERITKIIGTSTTANVYSLVQIDSIKTFDLIDTLDSVVINIPFVNNGNTPINLFGFQLSNNLCTIDTDTIKINPGDANYLPVRISTSDTSGILNCNLQYITNYSANPKNLNISFNILKSTVGIENETKSTIEIYPNPNEGTFNIVSAKADDYILYNQLGEVIQSGKIEKGINKINSTTFIKGVYILKLNQTFKKIIIK